MSYTKPHHAILQQLNMIARRAHQWMKIRPASEILGHPASGYLRHVGESY